MMAVHSILAERYSLPFQSKKPRGHPTIEILTTFDFFFAERGLLWKIVVEAKTKT